MTATPHPYWRSLDELAESPEFLSHLERESPRFAALARNAVDRRRFLQLMAASLTLGGVSACGPEPAPRQLLPYVEEPPGIVPGRSRYYATATTLDGYARGVLVEHRMGRPIKVEGNPDHPASRGASDAIMQATILGLYDPYRAQTLSHNGQIETWEGFVSAMIQRRNDLAARRGEGLRLLTGTITSPWIAAQIATLQRQFPEMRWHQWESLNRDAELIAAQQAFGRPLDPVFDVAKADVILAVESDLLSAAPGHLAYARDFAARRRPVESHGEMSRIYAIESTPTLIGAKADHRLALRPDEITRALRYLAAAVGAAPAEWAQQEIGQAAWLSAAAEDLMRRKGAALVHAGREQPAEAHLLVHAINRALCAYGATVRLIESVAVSSQGKLQSLTALAQDMAAGKVDTLLILGVNPVFTAPVNLDFTAALKKVACSVYWGQYTDETARIATWHIPATHEYESWGDARAFDGTISLQQPQTQPLYNGHSMAQLLAVMQGNIAPDDYASLREHWQNEAQHRGIGAFESFWRDTLRNGLAAESAAASVEAQPRSDLLADLPGPPPPGSDSLAVLFRADPVLWDGRFAENPWLLELPRPFTRLTWDNAALIAPATADRLGVKSQDVVAVTVENRTLEIPVFVLPGQAANCITLPLGFGRRAGGELAIGQGVDPYPLRSGTHLWLASNASVARTERRYRLATIQGHDRIAGRDLIREGTLAQFREDPSFLHPRSEELSLYPGYPYDGHAWAMAIDLNSCIACQACVTACQAENNVPIVGKDQVLDGRIMQWLRIDRYYAGPADAPAIAVQPIPCMHCENAPCEVVCPVQATVHDHEGLNAMVYNRCVGTRFCSNNCPYKVRRFNFLSYADAERRPAESWNPEVTVRDRGVMEKCTYCVQRIRTALIDADREDRKITDGEIRTACQQACPTQAIIFGDKNDPESAVSRRKASPLDYTLLEELNTRPRTSYQAIIRNPSPALGEHET